jgi:lysine biosynthesis protein LysW
MSASGPIHAGIDMANHILKYPVEKRRVRIMGYQSSTTAVCPECEGEINLSGRIGLGMLVKCPHCETELQVVEVNPVELDWAYEETFDDY